MATLSNNWFLLLTLGAFAFFTITLVTVTIRDQLGRHDP